MFIVVEGPNGVGKTTTSAVLAHRLREQISMSDVLLTKEPTDTELGRAIRAMNGRLQGRALGLACAADRADHFDREIAPALTSGTWVVSDRYVPSSLVLQRLDGLDTAAIWAMNETAVAPDLTVYLEDSPDVIAARLAKRPGRTRLEGFATPEWELELYEEAREFLSGLGWSSQVIDCSGKAPGEIAEQITSGIRR
jgi:dTMP kinase